MQSPEPVIRTDPTPAEMELLEDRLYEFNAKTTGIGDALGLAIFERDDQDEVVAGLCCHTWGGCCEIRQLWVHEKVRGLGIGRRLLELAEREARRRDCFQIILATHSFQAPGFYLRLGSRLSRAFLSILVGISTCICEKVLREHVSDRRHRSKSSAG